MDSGQDIPWVVRASLDLGLMVVAHGSRRLVAGEPIRNNGASLDDIGLDKSCQPLLGGCRDHGKPDPSGALCPDFCSTRTPDLVGCPTSSLSMLGATDVTLVYFDGSGYTVLLGTKHGSSQPMEPRPSRLVGSQSQLALQLHGRDAGGERADKVGGLNPLRQGHSSPMQNRAGRGRRLAAAPLALPEPSSWQDEGFPVAASRALEAVRPSRLGKVAGTAGLVGEPGLELGKGPREIGPGHERNRRLSHTNFGLKPIGMLSSKAMSTVAS